MATLARCETSGRNKPMTKSSLPLEFFEYTHGIQYETEYQRLPFTLNMGELLNLQTRLNLDDGFISFWDSQRCRRHLQSYICFQVQVVRGGISVIKWIMNVLLLNVLNFSPSEFIVRLAIYDTEMACLLRVARMVLSTMASQLIRSAPNFERSIVHGPLDKLLCYIDAMEV